jgi:allantoate deiminase
MEPVGKDHPVIRKAWDRLQELGGISDESGRLTRVFLSKGSRRAAEKLSAWMREDGLDVCHDALGNVRGRRHGAEGGLPLVLGSHYDTVIDAGRYDGALGIIAAMAALDLMATQGKAITRPVDVLGFADEEGVRFHATYLGSRACTGTLGPALMEVRDANGMTVADAIRSEGWHEGAQDIVYRKGEVAAYLEIHIEQGRVLEETGQPLGVVFSICGQTRGRVTLRGRTEHAGTTPMPLRRDALAAAAECVLAVEAHAAGNAPLVATVGKLDVHPGAGNAVPGEACFTLDIRHPDDDSRQKAVTAIQQACASISERRQVAMDFMIVQESGAVACDPEWTERLIDSANTIGLGDVPVLSSGAGHDAVVFSEVAPVAMLFVRCLGGLSHHPDESITREDLAVAVCAAAACIEKWNRQAHEG